MLLDVKITGFEHGSVYADPDDIAAFKARNKPRLNDIAAYVAGEHNMLDAESIAKHLFPAQDADVFLSHAHADEDAVVSLALALENTGLKVFVDSCVWGDVYDLLLKVDRARSLFEVEKNTFHYERTTRTAANMYMILNVALQQMIDHSEVMMFLHTDAVRVGKYVEGKEFIGSPWIFSELMFARMVGRRARPGQGLGLEQLGESLARAMDGVPTPLVRYVLPPSAHSMAASTLMELLKEAQFNAAVAKADRQESSRDHFLDVFYTALKPTAMERILLGWPPLDALQPAT